MMDLSCKLYHRILQLSHAAAQIFWSFPSNAIFAQVSSDRVRRRGLRHHHGKLQRQKSRRLRLVISALLVAGSSRSAFSISSDRKVQGSD